LLIKDGPEELYLFRYTLPGATSSNKLIENVSNLTNYNLIDLIIKPGFRKFIIKKLDFSEFQKKRQKLLLSVLKKKSVGTSINTKQQ
jgi:hypothetical protein